MEAVRKGQHFPRASAAPRVPAPAAVSVSAQSMHPAPDRSFLGVLLWETLSHERAADRAVAEFRLPGLLGRVVQERFGDVGYHDGRNVVLEASNTRCVHRDGVFLF